MSNPLNDISLVMFSTSSGHQGFRNLHKYSLKNLRENYQLNNFGRKVAAIRVHNNDEEEFLKLAKDYSGFNIIKEMGQTGLSDNPHAKDSEYGKYILNNYAWSIANTYSSLFIDTEFVLWYEADCYLKHLGDQNQFLDYIQRGLDLMRENKNLHSITLNGHDFPFEDNDLFKPGIYNFRPHLCRTKDMFNISIVFRENKEKFWNMHPEMIYKQIIQYLNPNAQFLQYNAKFLTYLYLGRANFLEYKEKYNLSY